MDYTIREMTQGDIKQLAELEKQCFSTPWQEQSFYEELSNKAAHYTVAEIGARIVGYIGYWQVVDECDVTNIAVAPDVRRMGIASALIAEVVRKARENALALVTLEVRKSNIPARTLYERFGFKALGERKNYYQSPRENAVIMTLMLGEE